MDQTLPVEIKMRCDLCRREIDVIVWLPEDNWKDLAEIEERKCNYCDNGLFKTVSYDRAEIKLKKTTNKIYLCIGSKEVQLLSLNSNSMWLYIRNLTHLPFYGNLYIDDQRSQESYQFIRDGIIIHKKR